MRVDLGLERMKEIMSNKKIFDIECIARPPSHNAYTHRQRLVNKALANRDSTAVSLSELCISGSVALPKTPFNIGQGIHNKR